METIRETLEEFEQTAWRIADTGFDATSWIPLRRRVIDLIKRGNRTVALIEGTAGEGWAAIRWDKTDSAVMLARAFGKVHYRLAATLERGIWEGASANAA